jgi:hypothetical protein
MLQDTNWNHWIVSYFSKSSWYDARITDYWIFTSVQCVRINEWLVNWGRQTFFHLVHIAMPKVASQNQLHISLHNIDSYWLTNFAGIKLWTAPRRQDCTWTVFIMGGIAQLPVWITLWGVSIVILLQACSPGLLLDSLGGNQLQANNTGNRVVVSDSFFSTALAPLLGRL